MKVVFIGLIFTSVAFAKDPVIPFSQWKKESPLTESVLNLFPGFQEPTVQLNKNGMKMTKKLEMVVYLTRAKAIANIGVANIKLQSLITEAALKQLDPDALAPRKIGMDQTMPNVAGRTPISNFQWCNSNPARPSIFLPALELSQAHMSRPNRPWCSPDPRAACYETCHIMKPSSYIESAIAAHNLAMRFLSKTERDYGMAIQAEVRYHTNESEFDGKLSQITNVGTPVGGVLEINIFYVNQVLLFGKMLIVLQPQPKDSQKTVVTALSAFGVRADAWNHSLGKTHVRNLLTSSSKFNSDHGILAGAPNFTRGAAESMAKFVEKP